MEQTGQTPRGTSNRRSFLMAAGVGAVGSGLLVKGMPAFAAGGSDPTRVEPLWSSARLECRASMCAEMHHQPTCEPRNSRSLTWREESHRICNPTRS